MIDLCILCCLNIFRLPLGGLHSLCLSLVTFWPNSSFHTWEQILCRLYNDLFGKDGITQYEQHYQHIAHDKFRNLWSAIIDFIT